MKKKLLYTTVLLAATIGSANAATSIGSLFSTTSSTLVSDNSAEFLIDVDGDGNVSQDDILVTIVGFNTIGSTTIGSGTVYNELTGITAVKIATASDVDLGPVGSDDSFGTQNIDLWQFTATALDAGDALYFDWSTGNIDINGDTIVDFTFNTFAGASNDGTLVSAAWEDGAQDYTRDSTIQAGLDSSTNGMLRFVIALDSTKSDFLSVIAPLDLTDLAPPFPGSTAVDNTNIAFDGTITEQYFAGLIFDEQITGGNGGFSSPSGTSGFPVFDNLDYTVTARVPEPTTVALLGIGLAGLGFSRRRRGYNLYA